MPCAETVRQRARELAQIDGREEFNEGDWAEAKIELHGGHEPNDARHQSNTDVAIWPRCPNEPAEQDFRGGSYGHGNAVVAGYVQPRVRTGTNPCIFRDRLAFADRLPVRVNGDLCRHS